MKTEEITRKEEQSMIESTDKCNTLEKMNAALIEENKKLKAENESLKKSRDDYSKYWQESEANVSRIKEQLNAVLVLIGNIK